MIHLCDEPYIYISVIPHWLVRLWQGSTTEAERRRRYYP